MQAAPSEVIRDRQILDVLEAAHGTARDAFLRWQWPLHSGQAFGMTGTDDDGERIALSAAVRHRTHPLAAEEMRPARSCAGGMNFARSPLLL
ncbi:MULTISPECIES: hypothetical protein [Methylosinus]|uniref:hypothetical protein n=1 Tax=Methylosinus TaxID=425 RepID=UPI00163D9DFA|nr:MULTISPECIES: hypothetical protein [Methylosinus]MBU3889681.1 hypothetical protein [Methylosinus sp. KRF6]